MNKYRLGLSMIVKNEAHVILRLLNSIWKNIDYWTIVDTGSTDGTQDIIQNFFNEKKIPGELIETAWVDFATCRNIALNSTEKNCDYGIWIDADEELMFEIENANFKLALDHNLDCYSIRAFNGGTNFMRKSIWKCGMDFKWIGPIHEILKSDKEKTGATLNGVYVYVRSDGASWKNIEEKYSNHAAILSEYTKKDNDPRWLFYTAQSYRLAGKFEDACIWYEKRAQVNSGYLEEIYVSKFMIARLNELLNTDTTTCIRLYEDAFTYDPLRGEALKYLILLYQRIKNWTISYVWSKYALKFNLAPPYPHRNLFIEEALYAFEILELHAINCLYTNNTQEGIESYWKMREQLKTYSNIDPKAMEIILGNEKYFPKELLKS